MQLRVAPGRLPSIAELAPDRGCFVGAAEDRCEIMAWDVARGTARRVTDRPGLGTDIADVEPGGEFLWWFDDDRAGRGSWRIQSWAGGVDRLALPRVPPALNAGLAMAADGTAAVGLIDERGFSVHLRSPGGEVHTVLATSGGGELVDLSADGSLLAVEQESAVRVLDRSGTAVAELPGPLWSAGFRPTAGTPLLLLLAECDGGYQLRTWTPEGGLRSAEWCRFESEPSTSWCPDGRVLVRQDLRGRSSLSLVDLARRQCAALPVPAGTVLDARMQPGNDLHLVWTDTRTPPALRTSSGRRPPGTPELPPVELPLTLSDRWTAGPGGQVHTLFTAPADGPGPWPTVFLVHGGPFQQDRDAYDPTVVLLAAAGFAVARVNYRGSTGYGPAWRNAFDAGVGLPQVADLAAARADLVREGLVEPTRTALAGWSWGGYLTLLALGTQPELWRAGAAVYPIADSAAAFRAGTPALRSLDARLFGGTPDQKPHRYAKASPMTYVDAVRAPVLLVAGGSDVKCPPEQVVRYAQALRARGLAPELLELDTGHESRLMDDQATVLTTVVSFLGTHLGGRVGARAM
ncbi:alpha/beta hydrolase family protein [Streptomyces xylophagus]|uniref:alpha/beta hydrolase family protein n=1 Tax=Streptomyces xylophagus TaxID=285514 RepID=UPI001F2B4507|nr:prolyl oligopeptidase family serine peptidase [Streptomyces xylophagus]